MNNLLESNASMVKAITERSIILKASDKHDFWYYEDEYTQQYYGLAQRFLTSKEAAKYAGELKYELDGGLMG